MPTIHTVTLPIDKNDRISCLTSHETQNIIAIGTDWGAIVVVHLDTLAPHLENPKEMTGKIIAI